VTSIRKGDVVRIQPEWSDPGDETISWVAAEDQDGGRVRIMAQLGLPLNPTQVVLVEWVERGDL
jgi:hypothetical protein